MKVVIEDMDDKFCIYDESGHRIEGDFESFEEAETYAIDCGYDVIDNFNL